MKVIKQLVQGDNAILDLLPSYTKKEFLGIIFLISNLNNKFFTHTLDDDWICISQNMKYSLFGQNYYRTKIYNQSINIFNLLFEKKYNGNSFSGISDGYEPTNLMKEIYQKWIQNNHYTHFEIIDIDMKDVKINATEVYEDDTREYTFSEKVSIDVNHIDKYIESFSDSHSTLSELKQLVTLKEILGSLNDENKLEIFYKEVMSGRYYSVGKNHIQGLKKDIRSVLLSDYNEYDLNTSAPVLMCHIYKKITGKNPPASIVDFIDEKVTYREIFRLTTSITAKQSKMLFTALFFDAKLIPNDTKFNSQITKELGVEKVNALIYNQYLKELRKDISIVYKTIYKYYEDETTDKSLVEYKNKKYSSKKKTRASIVSHIYQGLESVVLDTMIKFYTTETSDLNYVRIHDCLYTKVKIDEVQLENYILNEIGIKVLIKDRNSKHTLEYFTKKLYIFDDVYQCWGPYMNKIMYLPEKNISA